MSEPEYLPDRILSPAWTAGVASARFEELAPAHRDHLGVLRFLFGAVGDDDAAALGFLLFQPLDEHAIMERTKVDKLVSCHSV